MAEKNTLLTCKEAALLLKYSERHICNLIGKGKISATKDEDGKYFIDRSEFFRAYPDAMLTERIKSEKKIVKKESLIVLEQKVQHLQEMLDEKKNQNDFLMTQLENFAQKESKMLEALSSHARLLEFKESSGKITLPAEEPKVEEKTKTWMQRLLGL